MSRRDALAANLAALQTSNVPGLILRAAPHCLQPDFT